ncbi:phosphatase PAP2 family protein [Nocardioides sp.]|uniref:phosphatase PAP2 family protein n=1 Tax=Nocardioides sp. TaxID=35761 RepID=UPI002632EE6D|nr:phosphatase PAP2 family protein [Nocardioides sp.]
MLDCSRRGATAASATPALPTPSRTGSPSRHRILRWTIEFGTFGVLAVAYTVVRSLVTADPARAIAHAEWLASLQGELVRGLEEALNTWFVGSTVVAVTACYLYAVLHYVATPAVFLLSRRHGGRLYWTGYWSLVVASGLAVLVYATFPVAPPRLTPSTGIVDVMREFADYGWWGSAASAPRGIGDATNQYAAVPSMHFGWALWTSIQLWLMGGGARRTLAVAYPLLMTVVVIGTGNHFLIDVLAGGACVVVGYAVVTCALRWWSREHVGSRGSPVGARNRVGH